MSSPEKFSDLLNQTLSADQSVESPVINGTVVNISSDFVLVDIGRKSESLIPRSEFCDAKGNLEVAVGDTIKVAFERSEDEFGFGETPLSYIKAKRAAAWEKLEAAYENNDSINGFVLEPVKGGFTIALGSVRAFLPGSLVDVRPVRETSYLLNKEWKFKIVKLDKRRNNIVVSRKAVIEAESTVDKDLLLSTLEEGKVLTGIVKNLTEYGAFIDLGGIDGLLHITDMSWKRIKHPNQILNVGDEVEVVVLKFDPEKHRVSLGMKQLSKDPLSEIAQKYPIGSRLVGKVTNVTDYGCFIGIDDILEGLVHLSEMDWKNKNIHPSKIVQVGDEVEVVVLDIDEKRRRISLGLKQCKENPWKLFAEKYQKGDKLSGEIKSITDFGIFVGLEGDIDGLVHLSDISSKDAPEKALQKYSKGDEITVRVLSIDADRERISLGVKQEEEADSEEEAEPLGAESDNAPTTEDDEGDDTASTEDKKDDKLETSE